MDNDGVIKVINVGDVCLQTNTGMQLWLRGVKHALDVRFNLISVHMLDDGDYDNHFGHGKWKFTKDSVNAMDMEASLWHRRLSHISEKGLNCLAKKDMLLGLKNTELEKCSHCMKLWVYVLKTKDQVLEKFKQFQALVERQSGKKVKYIRSNNGDEYCRPFDGEALYTTVHVINLNPTVALNTKVPDQIWFCKDVKYDHLRVFGCKPSVHVPKDERSKLDMKTR
ncbi:hypothetical protein CR513_10875, partial [Mucuna pruriens]